MNYEFRNKKGFTLIEFIVALGIVIVLASVSVLTLRSIRPNLQLNGTIRNLVSDLRYAQQLAVTEQFDHGVWFSTTTGDKYQIIRHENGATTTVKEVSLPEGIDFQSFTNQEIKFNPYGATEAATTTLINTKDRTKTIRVSPSGFVKISD